MQTIDWIILIFSLVFIVVYGVWKGRRQTDLKSYFLSNRDLRWYTVLFSIMATQASAITFLSAPGQAYVDGMRFVQFYFGLPLGMIILSITAVPLYHKMKVFTAYEFLEQRFDVKTRILASLLFLVQRGLAAGLTIFAPALILSILLGWDIYWTNLIIGVLVIIYTAFGGTRAVAWTHYYQMLIILFGMVAAFFFLINALPGHLGFLDAVHIAGKMGRLNTIDFKFDLMNRYTVWTGILGGMFLQLSYFGTDQSQVQRYISGASVTQSRLGLLLNGIVKIPMQFSVLFIGAMVFVFFQFVQPPLFFNTVETERVQAGAYAEQYTQLEEKYADSFVVKKQIANQLVSALQTGDAEQVRRTQEQLMQAHQHSQEIKKQAVAVLKANNPQMDAKDTNYIFLYYVTRYLPAGLVGLVIAAIIAASMSSTSGELNALASTTIVDIYRRLFKPKETSKKMVKASRLATVLWGVYAILLAEYASRLGSLIEAVNILGSLFYGTILGIFIVAFYLKRIGGSATFYAAFIAEAAVVYCFVFTDLPFLWYNVVGCLGVVVFAWLFSLISPQRTVSV